jgi:type IV pilus assembly protein PilF
MRRLDWLVAVAILLLAGCATAEAAGKGRALSATGRTNLVLAQSYLERNQPDKAAEWAALALKSDPGAAEVHVVLALIQASSGNHKKAEREFNRALRIAPDDGAVLNAHASWLCDRGQMAEADEAFSRALLDGNYRSPIQALANAGMCARKAGQWSKAEAYLRRALTIAPQNGPLLLLLADTELRLGKILEAQAFVQRRDSLGSDAATLELAARIEDAAKNRHAAARYRQRLRDEFPDHVPTGEGARTP